VTTTGKGSGSSVRCDRCGRDNPTGLRFCRDCGSRLLAEAGAEPAQVVRASDVFAQRPAAPEFDFGPARAEPEQRACESCGATNPATGRFCFNCGSGLGRTDAAPQPTAAGAFNISAPVVTRPPAAPSVPPPARPSSGAAEPAVYCPKCRGANLRHVAFCQFCGTSLGENTPDAGAPIFGPQVAASARLVVIAQDGTPGRQYPLADEQTDIGREEGGILLPSDPYVSPRHARVFQRTGRFFVRDLASVNGVYVRIRAAERLQNADLVLIGLEVLRFEVVSDAEKGLGPATERGTRVFGSPSLPRYARLCQRTVEGVTRDVVYLGRDETVIGRESGDLVFTNDPFMSRRHAIFMRDPATNTFLLQDLGSSNGTYLGIRGEHELISGDHVRIGQHLFRLDVDMSRARS
jgi:pSer/pThr/pTyr-binding forkhead associated (FHA) protein